MTHWVYSDGDGCIRQVVSGLVAPVCAGLSCIEVDQRLDDPADWYVAGGVLVAYTEDQRAARRVRPARHAWSNAAMAWVDQLTAQERLQHADAAGRVKRRELLLESDWTQAADSPLNAQDRAAWAAWRQAVRDITLQAGWPLSPQWPEPPGNAG